MTGDLREYVLKTLYSGNSSLPQPVLDGLLQGDISPWAPFQELPPPPKGQAKQTANFEITSFGYFQVNGSS